MPSPEIDRALLECTWAGWVKTRPAYPPAVLDEVRLAFFASWELSLTVHRALEPMEAARVLGRAGAALGGAARAMALTPERRREIAQAAARTRWDKNRSVGA